MELDLISHVHVSYFLRLTSTDIPTRSLLKMTSQPATLDPAVRVLIRPWFYLLLGSKLGLLLGIVAIICIFVYTSRITYNMHTTREACMHHVLFFS